MTELPLSDNIDTKKLANLLNLKNLTTSYKIYWFYGMFEEIKLGNKKISFSKIAIRMISKSWYSIIEFKLNFGIMDQLSQIVLYIYKKYSLKKDILEDDLIIFLEELQDIEFKKMCSDLCIYVPYRLLTPFYPELKRLSDPKRNNAIKELSLKDNRGIYMILDEFIIINDNWYNYLKYNHIIIEGWMFSKLIYFLQTKNPNIPSIIFKISAPQKRNLTKATNYWKKIIQINPLLDIYSRKLIDIESSLSIDHFIPWSFVLHDEMWNLIPTTRSINSSKNDSLPDLNYYLDIFCQEQFKAFKLALKYNFPKNDLEDYLTLSNVELNLNLPETVFIDSLKKSIVPLHQIAANQGFNIWKSDF